MYALTLLSLVPTAVCNLGFGVSYDPNYETLNPEDVGPRLRADFSTIKSMGFDFVHTYWPSYDGQGSPNFPAEIADEAGLKIMVSLPVGTPWTDALIADMVNQCVSHGAIMPVMLVGSEQGSDYGNVKAATQQLVGQLYANCPGYLENGGTVLSPQTSGFWMDSPDAQDLATLTGGIAVDVYSFFVPQDQVKFASPQDAVDNFVAQLNKIKAKFPDKPVLITETGWPSGGSIGCDVAQCGNVSPAFQQAYYARIKDWARSQGDQILGLSYFQFHDGPEKTGPSTEQHFGVVGKVMASNQTQTTPNAFHVRLVNQQPFPIYVGGNGNMQVDWQAGCDPPLQPGASCDAYVASGNGRFCGTRNSDPAARDCSNGQNLHLTLIEVTFDSAIWFDISVIPAACTDERWDQNRCANTGGASYNLPVSMGGPGAPTFACRGPANSADSGYPTNCEGQAYFHPMDGLPNEPVGKTNDLTVVFLSGS